MKTTILRPGVRYTLAIVMILLLLVLLAGALTVPYLFESPSMWYKFGPDKTSLRIGKMLGLAAGVLILVQLPLAGRFRLLDRLFSMPALIRQHRIHAWAIAILALAHPVLVLYAERKWVVPLEARYWPEWVGVCLLLMILLLFAVSRWRKALGVPFHRWMPLHRAGGLIIAALLIVHVRYVSESFTDNVIPGMAVTVAAAMFSVVWMWVRSGWTRSRRRPYEVVGTRADAMDTMRVTLCPLTRRTIAYLPGQFVIVRFQSAAVSPEPHPFTLCSSPGRGTRLQITIRACGDWTRTAGRLRPGDKALIQGPFGRFGHHFVPPERDLILIAGGIGITPMLSMLRSMADESDPRSITLIWSNRSPRQVVFASEMEQIAAKLTGLRRIPIFTRNNHGAGGPARLNRRRLADILADCSRREEVFVCGPPTMMKQITTDLKALGFPARSIHTEGFGY